MDLPDALDYLNAVIGDPSRGLPEAVFRFASSIVPMVNVDLLIKDDRGQTLLTWREDEFYPPGWHIPGGIIRYKETAHDRIMAVAANELGAGVTHAAAAMAINELVMKEPEWRVRGHFISLLYECQLLEPPKAVRAECGSPPRPGEWAWHDGCPGDLYAAQGIYRQYLEHPCQRHKETMECP